MSTTNTYNLEYLLQKRIGSSTDDHELLVLFKTAQKLGNGAMVTVPTVNDLPTLIDTTGLLFYVESEQAIYYNYHQTAWVVMGNRINKLWTWGNNQYGKLGDGTTTNRSSPGSIVGFVDSLGWKQMSAGGEFSAGIEHNGKLWSWGVNTYGQLGNGNTTSQLSPVTTAGGGTTWSQISCSLYFHTAAIKTDGTMWIWGRNNVGQLGDNSTTDRSSPVTTAGGGTNWKYVSAGGYHNAAIKTDGSLWVWGYNNNFQLGVGDTVARSSPVTTAGGGTTWSQVSANRLYNTSAIKTDGSLWVWGINNNGQLGTGDTVTRSSPVTVSGGGLNWVLVSAGENHQAAIKTDGTLWTWGNNQFGQLGEGSTVNRSSPGTTSGGGTDWSLVSCGTAFTAGTKTNGSLWTWGNNVNGQLGLGDTTNRSSPVSSGINTWAAVNAGVNHTIGLAQ